MEEGFSPSFHPITVRWFAETFGRPTEVQTRTWERIATGTHLLVSAPTGSGKTLAAFLWPLDRLISGAWEGTGTRVLYVSPLKALNTDIRENLLLPLKGISEAFREAGAAYRQVTVAVRSGDTGQPERRRLLSHPPDILITTPESLNILLSTLKGQALLGGLRLVILDEIHGIVDNKRGTHLITAVERLVLLSGEFQRIGISATMNPMEEIARFLGGSRPETIPGGTVLRRRVVEIVDVPGGKAYDIGVMAVLPEFGPADWMKEGGAGLPRETAPPREPPMEIPTAKEGYWGAVAEACVGIIRRNLSTLFFANSRRMAEKITRLINEVAGETLAYSHHGSLSRELRTTVEKRFREGALRAIVATSSLEMGIDIGNLDEVVLIQAPPSVSSGLQRAGRAGHGVGRVSRVRILPLHGMDLVVSGVAAAAMARAELERIRIPEAPLDVLAQVILSITLTEPWRPDDLYDFIRRSSPYENLTRAQFDSVIGMLAGRYERARIRELSARISVDGSTGMITARPGAASLLFLSGGTIADRGYYAVRLGEAGSKMGELDEEFVWERKEGDRFSMGNRAWKIQRITDRDVEVVPVRGGAAMPPFWRGEVQGRSWSLSERIGEFMEEMDRLLELEDRERDARDPAAALASGSAAVEPEKTGQAAGAPEFPESPALAYAAQFLFDEAGRAGVVDFLRRQRIAAGCGLPCRGRIVAEWVSLPDEGEDSVQLVLHTLWGGRINRPLSMILAQALEEREGVSCEYFSDDNAILLLLPEAFPVSDLFALLSGRDILALLRKRLEATGIFGARFRENAGRALLLPRKSFSARMPLWLTRQKAKRLFRAVSVFPDFPITAETWRTCLADEFDLARLGELLEEVAAGTIELTETITSFPSPMANGIVYQKVNDLMYRGDDQKGAVSSITDEIIGEIAASDTKRLRIPTDVVGEFEGKKRRTAPGYVPADERELLDLAVERIVMTVAEWEEVTAVCASPEARAAGAVDARAAAPVSAAGASAARSPEDVSAAGASIPAGSSDFRISPWLSERIVRFRFSLRGPDLIAARETCARFGWDGEPADGRVAPLSGCIEDLAAVVGEWLRFSGPVKEESARALFGIGREDWTETIRVLRERGDVVTGSLTIGADAAEICDVENFKCLLRLTRRRNQPAWKPLPIVEYQRYLARLHGIGEWAEEGGVANGGSGSLGGIPSAAGVEKVKTVLETLWGFPAAAGLWEREILAARIPLYDPAWIDSLVRDHGLLWFGCGTGRISFALEYDLALFLPLLGTDGRDGREGYGVAAGLLSRLFPEGGSAGVPFWDLQIRSGLDSAKFPAALWGLVWRGSITNDRFEAVRMGIRNRFSSGKGGAAGATGGAAGDGRNYAESTAFRPTETAALRQGRPVPAGRSGFGRWKAGKPIEGMWRLVPPASPAADPMEREEEMKETARVLLARYGILFRELLERELPGLKWGPLFRSLRLMEFSGEVVTGPFFEDIPGVQFASLRGFSLLRESQADPRDRICWMNACDPASLAGLSGGLTPPGYPQRIAGNHLVLRGGSLVLVSRSGGKRVEFLVPPDDPGIPRFFGLFRMIVGRRVDPMTSVCIEEINGEPALGSPYRDVLCAAGFRAGYRGLTLYGS